MRSIRPLFHDHLFGPCDHLFGPCNMPDRLGKVVVLGCHYSAFVAQAHRGSLRLELLRATTSSKSAKIAPGVNGLAT